MVPAFPTSLLTNKMGHFRREYDGKFHQSCNFPFPEPWNLADHLLNPVFLDRIDIAAPGDKQVPDDIDRFLGMAVEQAFADEFTASAHVKGLQ